MRPSLAPFERPLTELQKRGAKYGKAWMAFSSHVVEDGLLITGQNPTSAEAVGEAVVKKLRQAN